MPLSVRLRSSRHHDLAGQVDLDVGALPEPGTPAFALETNPLRWSYATDLDVRRQADTEQFARTAVDPSLLLLTQLAITDRLERSIQRRLVVPAVVREHPDTVVVREVLGLDEVSAANIGRI